MRVIEAEHHKDETEAAKNDHPGAEDRHASFEHAREDDECPLSEEARHVEEASQPSGVSRLLFSSQAGDVKAVGDDVMRRGAESNDREQSNGVTEVAWQRQA